MVRSLAKIVLVVTILLVAVPSTQAQAAERRVEERSLLSWSFLTDLWEIFSGAWGDNGCILDPSGGCRDSAWGDNGCEMDPSGGRCGG